MNPTLLDLDCDELATWLGERDAQRFRADQLWQAIYRDGVAAIQGIATLPQSLRDELDRALPMTVLRPLADTEDAHHRVVKTLYELADGETIEVVLMRYARRRTVCVSTQVGCALACAFCATGQGGFVRDLTTGEIVAQALAAVRRLRDTGERLTNIVYMGMGEPFMNYDATLQSARILNDPRGLGLGIRSFTVSTAGVVPGILRLASEPEEINLAVSLHTVDDALRTRLVPLNRRYPVTTLLDACRTYIDATRRRVSFEVALVQDLNDTPEHAERMGRALRGMLCHVNLIPANPCDGSPHAPSARDRVARFAETLKRSGIPTTVRVARGVTIGAGCGQLRRRDQSLSSPR